MYAELKCKTCFSFLRGASQPEELIEHAARLGLKALGITDIDGVYGIPKAYQARKSHPGLQLIVGAEVTLSSGRRLPFLARDRKAYGLLCRILTASHAGRPKGQAELEWESLLARWLGEQAAHGLLAIPPLEWGEDDLDALRDALGAERVLLPLGRFLDGNDARRTERALSLGRRYGARIIATNDVHYHLRERRALQDVMTAIRIGKPLAQAGFELFQNAERHLKSAAEMGLLFRDLPEALENTLYAAELCTFCPSELRYRYPSEWIPAGFEAQGYLEKLAFEGAGGRYPDGVPEEMRRQLRHELELIRKLGFADYFLTIHEIVEFAKGRGILCQGRGAAANSAVCYCLGITAVNPVQMDLLFERFLSAERGEPPDIDVDFEHERREEVLQHVYEKYGRDRAAMVSAVITYRRRSAFREVGKALGVEVGTLSARELQNAFARASAETGIPRCLDLAERLALALDGFPRHLSIHSGGFTLSAEPITEIVPVEPARMEGRTIIQWDKYDLDYLGLLKVDLLSLGMLSALRKTLDQVGLTLYGLPRDDPPTYEMIRRADTVGTFQIESRAQMSMLGRLLPEDFYDLVVQVAIVRPGPIIGKMVHPYLKRRRKLEPVEYPDPRAERILKKTLGVPLFQEQVMKLAIELAGFTPGEADELRRAIGAWRSTGSIEKIGRRLMEGLVRGGLSPGFAARIFDQIQGFSMYGFPESHAASFAHLAYASAYLKCHHPAEFTCALLNSQPMGFYGDHTLIDDVKLHGVRVLPVDPRVSGWDCAIEDGAIRLGLRVVRGLSEECARRWIDERRARPFSGLMDFVSRARPRFGVLQALALGGAFECFGLGGREALWKALECRALGEGPSCGGQLDLFAALDTPASTGSFAPLSPLERIREEYGSYGLAPSGHPMPVLRKLLKLPSLTAAEAKKGRSGGFVTVSGLVIVRQRPPTAKGVTFATLEDETGFLDLILHPEVYEMNREGFLAHCFITVGGVIQRDANAISVLVKRLRPVRCDWEIAPMQYFSTMKKFGTEAVVKA